MGKSMDRYLMVIAAIFWSGAFIAGKFSIKEFPVCSLTFFRFLFASIVIFYMLIKKEADWKINKEDYGVFIILGLVGMVGYHIFFFSCLKYTTAVNSSLIGATNPIITTILAVIFLKEEIKPRNIFSILISFFGVILIITNGDFNVLFNFKFNIGDLLMLIAVICWASYAIISKKVSYKYTPLKMTAYSFLVCTIAVFPFTIMEKPWVYMPKTSIYGWMSVLYMSIFASVIGYLIQQISIKKIGPSKTSLYVNLVPVFSMILAFFILKENIKVIKIVAAAFIIGGVFLNAKPTQNKKLEEVKQ